MNSKALKTDLSQKIDNRISPNNDSKYTNCENSCYKSGIEMTINQLQTEQDVDGPTEK